MISATVLLGEFKEWHHLQFKTLRQ